MSRLQITVTGMSCTGCESRIATSLSRLDGVRKVDADHRSGSVVVDHDPAEAPEQVIRQRLSDAGYEIQESQPQ
ncbi:MAG: heavy-metal-associated domain-containing protein [Acidimicrobiia bacterium]